VADIREVMKEHAAISEINLWPGFAPELSLSGYLLPVG